MMTMMTMMTNDDDDDDDDDDDNDVRGSMGIFPDMYQGKRSQASPTLRHPLLTPSPTIPSYQLP